MRLRLALCAVLLLAPGAVAQRVTPSGGAYLDYGVALAPDSSAYDQAFAVRRAWATATVDRGRTTARLRLETDEGTVPTLRLFEAFVRFDSLAGPHRLALGLLQMEGVRRVQDLWAHRFLDRTMLAETAPLSSRDLGVQLDGPLGPLDYAVSFTSGRGLRTRPSGEARLSAVLATHRSGFHAVATFDQLWVDNGPGTLAGVTVAYGPQTARVGVETFVQRGERIDQQGVSVFAMQQMAARWRLVGRVNVQQEEGQDGLALRGVVGAVYRHDRLVELSPNVLFDQNAGQDLTATARLTASLRF